MKIKIFEVLRKRVEDIEVRESNKLGELSEEDHAFNDAVYMFMDILDEVEQEVLDGTLE